MNSKSTKAKRKAIPAFTLAELDKRDGVERFDHLTDPLDKYLAAEEHKDDGLSDRPTDEVAVLT